MNLSKIAEACEGSPVENEYLVNVAHRLTPLLGDHLSINDCFALMAILAYHSFQCSDGFIINDERTFETMLGLSGGAIIAASFSEDSTFDWNWFRTHYPGYDKEGSEFSTAYNNLLNLLTSSSLVRMRHYGETN